jgi:spermidine synthase
MTTPPPPNAAPSTLTTLSTTFAQPGHPPATLSHHKNVRFLHLGTSWIQGAMNLRQPDAIELDYVRLMMIWTLFQRSPRKIVQLGLGSAALTKFCYRHFPEARIDAIDLNPNVIAICAAYFGLPPNDARLTVQQRDAMDFVQDAANHGHIDVMQVDLYDEAARGPVLSSEQFYQACHDCLSDNGVLTANIFGEPANIEQNISTMAQVFDAVVWLPEVDDANIVVLAFRQAPQIDFRLLYARAVQIKLELNLPAKAWVRLLQEWMADQS